MSSEDFMKKADIHDIITRARLELVFGGSWVVEPCMALEPMLVPPEMTDKIWRGQKPTMATDHKRLYYAEEFVRSLTFKQLVGVIVHEGMHRAFGHCLRLRGRDPVRANIAGDVIINHYVIDMGHQLPSDALMMNSIAQHIVLPKGISLAEVPYKCSMEEVYEMFKKDPNGKGPQQQQWGYVIEPTAGDGSDLSQSELEVERQNAKLEMSAAIDRAERSKPGSTPGNLQDMINEMRKPKVNWRFVLNDWLIGGKPAKYSYERINSRFRRFAKLPVLRKRELGTLVIFKDTSGSVSDEWQKQFLAEMNNLSTTVNFEKIITVPVDYTVHENGIQIFGPGQPITTSRVDGRGGTTFTTAFEWLKKQTHIKPYRIIYMTDMEGEFPRTPYPVPTLWVATTGIVAPWGTTVRIGD